MKIDLLISAFSKENDGGLYQVQFDPVAKKFSTLQQLEAATGCLHATYDPAHKLLAVASNSVAEKGPMQGLLLLRKVQVDGTQLKLSALSATPTGGATACYASLNPAARSAYVAHYSSPSVAALQFADGYTETTDTALLPRSGSSVDPKRQTEPHPHCSAYNSTHGSLWCADLGTDEVVIWPLSTTGQADANNAQAVTLPAGSGPRHVVFHPRLPVAYSINELNSTVSVLTATDGHWQLHSSVATVAPADMAENYLSTAAVSPCNRFLLVANRGHDSISIFVLDQNGIPQANPQNIAAEGGYPTFLSFDSSGEWLFVANQKGNRVVAFAVSAADNALGLSPVASVECPMPTWVQSIASDKV